MTKSELIDTLAEKHNYLPLADVKTAVDIILEHKTQSLASGERVEIRGFGSFNLRHWPARSARNSKTGESVALPDKYKAHFKPGKELKERVNKNNYLLFRIFFFKNKELFYHFII